jgi:osmotically-inducible protein OsmY
MVFKPQCFHDEKPVVELEHRNEEPLETAVARQLAISQGMDASGISVTASGATIFLSGKLMDAAEIDRVLEIVLAVPGVEKITHDLQVD